MIKEHPVYLKRWEIRIRDNRDWYLIGDDANTGECVIFKSIRFDPDLKIGVTELGKRYRMMGERGITRDTERTWNQFKLKHGITEI